MTTGGTRFPALVQYQHDDELGFVASKADWARMCAADEFNASLQPGDRLIDSAGQVYRLLPGKGGPRMDACAQALTLNEVLVLVRNHASVQGNCCVAKLGARSIDEAIHLVAYLTD
ncbi:DUF4144 family protein [Marinobacterium rhizophilum]|uniref:DUF4144 family protein n=1 Tax=Marinobacterium rhizophilum TaxID=420402 RepID=UPI00036224F2|nr:DUF4144 family protein [Marinobacterium rhizophilum]